MNNNNILIYIHTYDSLSRRILILVTFKYHTDIDFLKVKL